MREDKEYVLCRQISSYLRYKYPSVHFHFDLAGNNLSKAQAGKMKAIQGPDKWPDLFIAESRNDCSGLFIELKAEGTKVLNKKGEYIKDHVKGQVNRLEQLRYRGYRACLCIGYDDAVKVIDDYLRS